MFSVQRGLLYCPDVQTLKVKVSLKTGQRFLRWTLVSNFFFLSGKK